MITLSDGKLTDFLKAPKNQQTPRETDGLFSLTGATLEQGNRRLIVVTGKITHFNEERQEARGRLSVFSVDRLSMLAGPMRIHIHGLEFNVMMMAAAESKLPGEQAVRFLARLEPSVHSIERIGS